MKNMIASYRLSLLALAILGVSGCTNVSSSRNVNDPRVSGTTLAIQVCSACHGVTGESVSPMFPKLAGQSKEYLVAQLADFKGHDRSDSRGTQYMWGYTQITTKQVDELAEYFSAQPAMLARKDKVELLTRGEAVFRNGVADKGVVQCVACHGASGEGNGAFPRLAGQHANYVLEQIKVFQLTAQRPRGAAMQQVTHELTEPDAIAVSHYIESIGTVR